MTRRPFVLMQKTDDVDETSAREDDKFSCHKSRRGEERGLVGAAAAAEKNCHITSADLACIQCGLQLRTSSQCGSLGCLLRGHWAGWT